MLNILHSKNKFQVQLSQIVDVSTEIYGILCKNMYALVYCMYRFTSKVISIIHWKMGQE